MILKSINKTTFPLPSQFTSIKYLTILQREPGCLLIGADNDGIMISAHHIKVGILKKYKIPAITNLLALGNHHILMEIAGMTVGIYEIRMANLQKIEMLSVQQFTTVSGYTIRQIVNKIIEVQLFFNDRDILIYQFSQIDGKYGMIRYQTDTVKILFETQNGLHKTKLFLNSKKGQLFCVNPEKKTIEKTKLQPAKPNELCYIGIPGEKQEYLKLSIKSCGKIQIQNVVSNKQITKIIQKDLKFPQSNSKNCLVKTHLNNVLIFFKEQSNFLKIMYELKTSAQLQAKMYQRTRYCYQFFWVKKNQLLVLHPNKCRVSLEQFISQKEITQINQQPIQESIGQGWKPVKILQRNQISTSKTVMKSKQPEPIQKQHKIITNMASGIKHEEIQSKQEQKHQKQQQKANNQQQHKIRQLNNLDEKSKSLQTFQPQKSTKNLVQEKSQQLINSIKQKIQLQDQAINRITKIEPSQKPKPNLFNFDYKDYYKKKEQQMQEKLFQQVLQELQELEEQGEIVLDQSTIENQKTKLLNSSPIKSTLNFSDDCKIPPTKVFEMPADTQPNKQSQDNKGQKDNDEDLAFLEQCKEFHKQNQKQKQMIENQKQIQDKQQNIMQNQASKQNIKIKQMQRSKNDEQVIPEYERQIRKTIQKNKQQNTNFSLKQTKIQQQMQKIQFFNDQLLQKIPTPCEIPEQFQEKRIIEKISQYIYNKNSQFMMNEATNIIEQGFEKIYANQWETLTNNSSKIITQQIKLNQAIINKIVKQKQKLLSNYQTTIDILIQQDKKQMAVDEKTFMKISNAVQQTKNEIFEGFNERINYRNYKDLQNDKQGERIKQKHNDFLGKVKGIRQRIQNTLKKPNKVTTPNFKSVHTRK